MSGTMPAVVNYAPEPRSVELRSVPVPSIGDDDVLLRVAAASVCGSDLHQWLGGASWPVRYPVVLGHEFSGVVDRVGARVQGFSSGDRVVSETAAVVDPTSPFVRDGRYHLDPQRRGFGYGADGAMTTFVRVPARCLHHVPDGLSLVSAALVEPCCVAYSAVVQRGGVRLGDQVVVLGPGPIGLLCAAMAMSAGATVVVAGLPRDEARLAVARDLGAETALVGDVADVVRGVRDGQGADLVVDAAGVSAALETAMALVRPGGAIAKVGWGPQPQGFSLDPIVQKAVSIHGSFSHTWAVWERVIALLAEGTIDLRPFVGATLPLERWEGAFEAMHDGTVVKAVLLPDGEVGA
jgi:L-iditol 2-dehydrogenase